MKVYKKNHGHSKCAEPGFFKFAVDRPKKGITIIFIRSSAKFFVLDSKHQDPARLYPWIMAIKHKVKIIRMSEHPRTPSLHSEAPI